VPKNKDFSNNKDKDKEKLNKKLIEKHLKQEWLSLSEICKKKTYYDDIVVPIYNSNKIKRRMLEIFEYF